MGGLSRAPAHGGMGAVAGAIAAGPQINAQLHRSLGVVRVWQGVAGRREEFTVDEARLLCAKADTALTSRSDGDEAGLWLDRGGAVAPLIVGRLWLIHFVAAVRRALRTLDAADRGEPAGTAMR